MTLTPNVLTTELRDHIYNQCVDNTCCYSFFIYPTGWIRVCSIRFSALVKIAENHVSYARKKIYHGGSVQIEKSVPRDNCLISVGKASKYQNVTIGRICRFRRPIWPKLLTVPSPRLAAHLVPRPGNPLIKYEHQLQPNPTWHGCLIGPSRLLSDQVLIPQ